MIFRIGHGYDVHRLVEDRPLIMGGVHIPFERGLDGHSDADVLVHAVMDALLGAAALPDIGQLFPPGDPDYLGADSVKLLSQVMTLLEHDGWKIGNIDCTIVAQQPKMSPYIPEMRRIIAAACAVEMEQINIKATTEEHLGFTGEGLGIAAHALALLQK